jgi:glycine oxidase
MSRARDVVVVGAGVIGCAVAWELARRGVSVAVVDRDSPGREASWAAAGMLSPLAETGHTAALLELADASLSLYPAFVAALLADTDIDVAYRTDGCVHVALDADDEAAFAPLLAAPPAYGVERLDGPAVRTLEPALADSVRSGVLVRRDHRVDNRRLGQALWSAALGAGATFRLGATAAGVLVAGGAACGVRLADGATLHAGIVVIAAGAWSGQLEGLPAPLPVRPVRGQMFAVREDLGRSPLGRVVTGPGCYLVPRDGGLVLVGATVEEVGFRPGPTPAGIAGLAGAAVRMVPDLGGMPIAEVWSGFRPATPDGLPILGPDPDLAGLYYATGHFRNGILLAPGTAAALADALTGTLPSTPLDAFGPGRFRS